MSKVEWYIGMSLKDLERKAIEKAMEYFGETKQRSLHLWTFHLEL